MSTTREGEDLAVAHTTVPHLWGHYRGGGGKPCLGKAVKALEAGLVTCNKVKKSLWGIKIREI